MGYRCCVPNCFYEGSGERYASFPVRDPALCAKWVEAIQNPALVGKSPEKLHRSYRVCSKHFESKWLRKNYYPGSNHSVLFAGAVPTLHLPAEPILMELNEVDYEEEIDLTEIHVEELSFDSLDKICRTCLAKGDLVPLFEESSDPQFSEILSVISLKVTKDDGLPMNICKSCSSELNRIYTFKQLCERSETALQYYLSQEKDEKTPEKLDIMVQPEYVPTYKCNRCKEEFSTKAELIEHRKTVSHVPRRMKKCVLCSKTFTASHLKIHMRSHTSEKPYSCPACDQKFSLKGNLRRHILTHTGERPYKCNLCEKSFTQSSTLTMHMQIHNESEKSFLCSTCGRGFTCMAGLKSHSKTHSGIRPYSCEVCGKRFTHSGTMKSHVLIHTGQKPFVCSICGRAFTQRNHLRYHALTHSGEKSFECSVCNKAFALKGNLTVHMRTHTGETPYYCSVCGRGFYDSSSMKKHEKGHVN